MTKKMKEKKKNEEEEKGIKKTNIVRGIREKKRTCCDKGQNGKSEDTRREREIKKRRYYKWRENSLIERQKKMVRENGKRKINIEKILGTLKCRERNTKDKMVSERDIRKGHARDT